MKDELSCLDDRNRSLYKEREEVENASNAINKLNNQFSEMFETLSHSMEGENVDKVKNDVSYNNSITFSEIKKNINNNLEDLDYEIYNNDKRREELLEEKKDDIEEK